MHFNVAAVDLILSTYLWVDSTSSFLKQSYILTCFSLLIISALSVVMYCMLLHVRC